MTCSDPTRRILTHEGCHLVVRVLFLAQRLQKDLIIAMGLVSSHAHISLYWKDTRACLMITVVPFGQLLITAIAAATWRQSCNWVITRVQVVMSFTSVPPPLKDVVT